MSASLSVALFWSSNDLTVCPTRSITTTLELICSAFKWFKIELLLWHFCSLLWEEQGDETSQNSYSVGVPSDEIKSESFPLFESVSFEVRNSFWYLSLFFCEILEIIECESFCFFFVNFCAIRPNVKYYRAKVLIFCQASHSLIFIVVFERQKVP